MQIQTGARSYASAAEMRADHAEIRRRLMGGGVLPEQMPAEPDPPVVVVEVAEPETYEQSAEASEATELPTDQPCEAILVSHKPQFICTTIGEIKVAVCSEFGISIADLDSEKKTWWVVTPRQIAIALSRKLTGRSYPIIGRAFNRDHTTVMHSVFKLRPILGTVALGMSDTATVVDWVVAMRAAVAPLSTKKFSPLIRSSHCHPWTEAQAIRARNMRRRGRTYAEIGQELGRSINAVHSQLRKIMLTPEQREERLEQMRKWRQRRSTRRATA